MPLPLLFVFENLHFGKFKPHEFREPTQKKRTRSGVQVEVDSDGRRQVVWFIMGACVVGFQACFLAASVLVDKIERDVSVQSTLMYPIVP